jgi:hypothetical protein
LNVAISPHIRGSESRDRWAAGTISSINQDAFLKQQLEHKLFQHRLYINQHGQDMPEIRNWKWGAYRNHGANDVSTG